MQSDEVLAAIGEDNVPLRSCRSLCHKCSRIDVEQLTTPGGYLHYDNASQWIESLATCRLCRLFLDNCRTFLYSPFEECIKDRTSLNDHSVVLHWPCKKPDATYGDEPCMGFGLRGRSSERTMHVANIPVFTEESDPAAAYGIRWRRNLPSNTGCDSSMSLAKSWLWNCLTRHNKEHAAIPRVAAGTYIAARLLEITCSQVRAISASTVTYPYATISYCWGNGAQWPWGPQQIPRHEIDARVADGLHRDALPKTIRDAVSVTERLGLRYLWVDALCILQDDFDFATESVKMAEIYSQACVNLSASSGTSNSDGLFNKRSRSQHHHYKSCVKVEARTGNAASTLYFCHYTPAYVGRVVPDFPEEIQYGPVAFSDEVEQGHLSRRAWVCQERTSSPRTIHFGRTQLFWHCIHTVLAEDNLDTRVNQIANRHEYTNWRSFFFPSGPEPGVGIDISDEYVLSREQLDLWYSLLIPRHYSTRQLTYDSDKLIAISGLAKQVWRRRRSMAYIAGLWSVNLLDGLSWTARGSGHRIAQYVAPSWSWASRSGEIEYGPMGTANASFECEVIKWEVTTSNGDQFGPVVGATLELNAACVGGLVYGEYLYPFHKTRTLKLETGATGEATMDDDGDDNLQVFALLLRQDFVGAYFLLVVESVESETQYSRVGMASVTRAEVSGNPANRFEGLEKRRWVLV